MEVMRLSRGLKPCGTIAAARRHQRNGEELCSECKQAVRDEKNDRKRAERAVEVAEFQDSMSSVEIPEELEGDDIDPLTEALDSLKLVRRALHSDQTMPKDIGPLTRRRDELVDRIKGLEKASEPVEVSVFDELEQKREASRNRAAG